MNTAAYNPDQQALYNPDYVFDERDGVPVFIHSEIDDFGLTPEAFRVYCHLVRRMGRDGRIYPGLRSIGKVCFGYVARQHKVPSAAGRTTTQFRRRATTEASQIKMATAAIQELVECGLIRTEARFRDSGGRTSNAYYLQHQGHWKPFIAPLPVELPPLYQQSSPPSTSRVAPPLPVEGQEGTPSEGTPSEGTPSEDQENKRKTKTKKVTEVNDSIIEGEIVESSPPVNGLDSEMQLTTINDRSGARAAMPDHDIFAVWWKDYYRFCIEVNCSAGSKAEAWRRWQKDPALYQSQWWLDGDFLYRQQKRHQFANQGKAIGVRHGVRYLRSDDVQEAWDRHELMQRVGTDITNPEAVRAASKQANKKAAMDAAFEQLKRKYQGESIA